MKRLLGGVLVLAVAAFGVAAYWFGVQTEREYNAMIQRSADWQNFKLTGEEYTRGVFSSEAKAILELRNPPTIPVRDNSQVEEPLPFKVMLSHKINHGPIPFGMLPHGGGIMRTALAVIETKASLDPRFKELFKEHNLPGDRLPTMDMFTVLKWGGESDTHLTIHPFKGELGGEKNVALDFSGLKLWIGLSPDFKHLKGTLSMDGFEAAVPQVWDLSVRRMSGSFDQVEGMSGVYLGDVVYSLDLIGFKHRDPVRAGKDVTVKGLSVKTQARESGNDLSSSTTFYLDQIETENGSFSRAIFDLELRNLDGRALSGFQKAVKALQNQTGDSEQLAEKTLAAFLDLLPKLLKNSPEIEIRQLGFVSPDGEIKASARLTVDGRRLREPLSLPMLIESSQLDASVSAEEKTLLHILKSLESSDRAESGMELEESSPSPPMTDDEQETQIRNTLSALVARRFLVLENGVYKGSAKYASGELNLNGQPIRLDRLLRGE
jgi:uncharacterized protein YdgA (DUF945 family)